MPTENIILDKKLIEKYSISVPRYTSYPTAPEWNDSFNFNEYLSLINLGNDLLTPISLYFHLPFCESRCNFCACNVVISKKREIIKPYLNYLKKEILNIGKLINKKRIVEQIHFGGGTPTYFSPEDLAELFLCIEENFNIGGNCEIGIEVDPRVTTYEHMEMLSSLGFNRISMGVQDFNNKVQETINRIQPVSDTREIIDYARGFGFYSINVDLIYGLPFQTKSTFEETIYEILKLNPDRIALFHYAHLPNMIPAQSKYIPANALPTSDEKIEIFQCAVNSFLENGFNFIGLDHFAKEDDELTLARKNKTLHRNFQGYTTKAGCDLFGFGITAISSIQNAYFQNQKKLNSYYDALDKNESAIFRGKILSRDDEIRRSVIMKMLCHGIISKREIENEFAIDFNQYFNKELDMLAPFQSENLISLNPDFIVVSSLGQYFLRNIASTFDIYYHNNKNKIFSKAI